MYVPKFIIDQEEEIKEDLEITNEIKTEKALGFMILIIIDYIYHHNNEDYDGGLSFLDRINKKLGKFHKEWNVEQYKDEIRNAPDPQLRYIDIIEMMLQNEEDRLYYGV